jgi:site-specific DNA recombinase
MTATSTAPAIRTTAARTARRRPADQQRPRRAAIYVRISLDSTGEGLGVQRQQEDAEAIIAGRGWTLAGVYTDNSISASDAKKFRPGYAQLLRDYGLGLFDALVVWDLDRLTRQPRQLEDWIDAAEGRGLALVTTNGDADLTTDGGRMYARIKLSVARAEIERKSARHRRALQQHAEAGRAPHGIALLGYTTKGDTVPAEAELVGRIYDSFLAGESLRSLARALTDDGIPTRSAVMAKTKLDDINADPDASTADRAAAAAAYQQASQAEWNTRTVRDILTNPRYAGFVKYQGDILTDDHGNRLRGNWEPLVKADDWEVVQARLADPARKTNKVGTHRRYLGSSLFVCDQCSRPVETVNGGRYTCRGHFTRLHEGIDRFVLDVIAERLARPDFPKLLAPDAADVKPLTDAARKLRRRIETAENDYANGDIDAKLLRRTKDTIAAELNEVESKLAAMTGGAALGALAGAADPAEVFRTASVMGQRAIIGALAEVRIRRAPSGRRVRGWVFDTETMVINWRHRETT